jgi:hypothetical protein
MSAPTTPIRQSERPAAGAGAAETSANGHSGRNSAVQQNQNNLRSGQLMVSAIPTRLQAHSTAANNGNSSELTVQQLLAQSQSPANMHTRTGDEYKRETAAPGSSAANNTGLASWRKGQGFKAWETELLRSAEVKRKADVAQLCKRERNASFWLQSPSRPNAVYRSESQTS